MAWHKASSKRGLLIHDQRHGRHMTHSWCDLELPAESRHAESAGSAFSWCPWVRQYSLSSLFAKRRQLKSPSKA
jgi:hypothetical protein